MCQTFPTVPLRGSIELRPCDRCFGPEWIVGMVPFPFTDSSKGSIIFSVCGEEMNFKGGTEKKQI